MHELLLFSSVPHSRHQQIMSILAGLTATPTPRRILEFHHILRPNAELAEQLAQKVQVGASQDVETGKPVKKPAETADRVVYSDLVEDATQRESDDDNSGDFDQSEFWSRERWTLQSAETPEAGPNARNMVSRRKTVTHVDADDVASFASKNRLILVNRYIVEGHEFVHRNTLFRLHRCLQVSSPDSNASIGADLMSFNPVLLDRSGSYILQASVSLEDQASTDLLSQGRAELESLKDEFDGCIEFGVPSRLALDTKVK